MDLVLFCVLLALSLVLIGFGLFRQNEHTELALIGFLFLFLLSLNIIGQDIQYKTGTLTNTTYIYDTMANLNSTIEISTDVYDTFTLGDQAHNFGYWLAVGAAIGFFGVIFGLRKTKW